MRREFAAAVKDYLRDCEEQNLEPEKPASGKLLLRVPPEIHSRAIIAAKARGKSLNQWATEALQRAVDLDPKIPTVWNVTATVFLGPLPTFLHCHQA